MTLFAEEPAPVAEPAPRTTRCGAETCRKVLTDPVSIALGYGPDCARQRGITTPGSPRIRSHAGGDVPGQGDLLAGETPHRTESDRSTC